MDHSEVLLQLRLMLDHHLSNSPHLSLHSVAIRSGVAFTTLSRILKGQQKSSVSPHVTLELVAFLKKEYRIPLLLAKLPAPIERYLSSNFGKFLFH